MTLGLQREERLGQRCSSRARSRSQCQSRALLDYIEVNQPSKPTDQSGFSVCSHGVSGIGNVERMVSIASQTSDVRAWELARDIMRPLLDKIFCVPAFVSPSRARRVHCSAMAESSCDHTVWSISSAMNTLQCII